MNLDKLIFSTVELYYDIPLLHRDRNGYRLESYSAKLIIKYAEIAPSIEENLKVLIKNENKFM